ncbi:MAG: hypothetical protein QNJ62_04965 [Methyloceanibacter sp.]|nr:hypothetical protein [Methyloceanibacter sp.]
MSRYAANTDVSSHKSRDEIERTLTRYGATGFIYGWQENQAVVAFRMNERHIKFSLPMPDRNAKEFTQTPTRGNRRSESAAQTAYEQAVRQRWRALALVIKAKLEAVECGITEFDDEFMAHIVLPDGATIGEHMRPQIQAAYDSGNMPPLLPHYT